MATPTLDLTPAPLNIKAHQGDAVLITLTVTDDDGLPIDLTGHTAAMEIRRDIADKDQTVIVTAQAVVLDPPNGIVEATVPKEDLAVMTGQYLYDLQVVSSAGDPQTIISGYFTVTSEVTR